MAYFLRDENSQQETQPRRSFSHDSLVKNCIENRAESPPRGRHRRSPSSASIAQNAKNFGGEQPWGSDITADRDRVHVGIPKGKEQMLSRAHATPFGLQPTNTDDGTTNSDYRGERYNPGVATAGRATVHDPAKDAMSMYGFSTAIVKRQDPSEVVANTPYALNHGPYAESPTSVADPKVLFGPSGLSMDKEQRALATPYHIEGSLDVLGTPAKPPKATPLASNTPYGTAKQTCNSPVKASFRRHTTEYHGHIWTVG